MSDNPLEAVGPRWAAQDPTKIQLFSLPTPNGVKVAAALEELGLPYEAHRIDFGTDDQNDAAYSRISPNNKIPVIIDPDGLEGGGPIAIMESAAILLHLADKAAAAVVGPRLVPASAEGRLEALQWLFFQVGHIGPMFGQFGHFKKFAGDKCDSPYPLERYTNESKRLLGVLEQRLEGRDYILGADYSIADISIWPWVQGLVGFYEAGEELEVETRPNVLAWYERCTSRPASVRAPTICAAP